MVLHGSADDCDAHGRVPSRIPAKCCISGMRPSDCSATKAKKKTIRPEYKGLHRRQGRRSSRAMHASFTITPRWVHRVPRSVHPHHHTHAQCTLQEISATCLTHARAHSSWPATNTEAPSTPPQLPLLQLSLTENHALAEVAIPLTDATKALRAYIVRTFRATCLLGRLPRPKEHFMHTANASRHDGESCVRRA